MKRQDWTKVFRGVFSALFFLSMGALLFSRAMAKSLNHDEHQFVASGQLLADHGLLPYRDYPYHHQPVLVFLYGGLYQFTSHGLMGARMVSVLAGALTVILLFYLVHRYFRIYAGGNAILAGLVCVLVYVTNPVVAYTSGLAWNHDFATLLSVAGVVIFPVGVRVRRSTGRIFLAGLMIGLAIGTRLTYAPGALPFFAALFLFPDWPTWRSRIRMGVTFLGGLGLALTPSFLLFLLAPSGFVFGNYVYPQLNTVYRQLMQLRYGMTLGGKLSYFGNSVLWDSQVWFLFLGFLFVAINSVLKRRTEIHLPSILSGNLQIETTASQSADPEALAYRVQVEGLFLAAMAFCLLAGAFVPTPPFLQYFFAPLPFLALCLFWWIATFVKPRFRLIWLLLLVLLSLVPYLERIDEEWDRFQYLGTPDRWVPMEIHRLGEEVTEQVSSGSILTLAPIVPLEGNLDVYPAFATGPFTWRTAALLSEDRQQFYEVISPQALDQYLTTNPPTAVLTGYEGDTTGFEFGDRGGLERPLIAYARQNGFTAVPLEADRSGRTITLWVLREE